MENLGKTIVVLGVVVVIIGLIIWLLGDKLSWFGQLPGDISIRRPGFSFYMPCASMIIVSIVLSIILSVISRLLK